MSRVLNAPGSKKAPALEAVDLGAVRYRAAYERQVAEVESALARRERDDPVVGRVLLLEHDPPVITISRRPDARTHLVATSDQLQRAGVTVEETDRGGDITYHGPGQLVAYPILDLKRLRLGLHDYMRLLERAVMTVCDGFGVPAHRDACATGVWVGGTPDQEDAACGSGGAKVCAMGVRVRKWVTMHGLALNVTTNLAHFDLIVPCGLDGRRVTSLQRQLHGPPPAMSEVKQALMEALTAEIRILNAAS